MVRLTNRRSGYLGHSVARGNDSSNSVLGFRILSLPYYYTALRT